MAKIRSVSPDCGFYGKVKEGDELLTLNGKKITDCFDMMYHFDGFFLSPKGTPLTKTVTLSLKRGEDELTLTGKSAKGELGIEFDSFLMDTPRSCKNKCCFCFIDQLPKNMRETMYYKDDDYRLSIIYGNYVTLTNLTAEDVKRIKELHLSPLNVSVHTTDPELRVRMMKNPNAKNVLPLMKEFAEAGILLRAQIVLCKGINDGENLLRSMNDLKALYPALSSVSVVPVGLTSFREGLEPLEPFEKEDSERVLDLIETFTDGCLKDLGTRLIYPSDEFFLSADRPIPEAEYYEDFEQIENGVGMLARYKEELSELMEELGEKPAEINFSMITGYAAAPFFESAVIPAFKKKLLGMKCSVYPIKNDFFGERITVAGLITGKDVIDQLKGRELGDFLLIPDVMLRDDAFLDDVTVSDVETALGIEVRRCGPDPDDMYRAITGEDLPSW